MVLRWRWVTLAGFVLAGFLGCSGKHPAPAGKPGNAHAGEASAGTGGSTAEGGEGGLAADAARGGTQAAGRAGFGGAGTAGTGTTGGFGASGGSGALGGSGGMTADGGSAGLGGSGGSRPAGWTCLPDHYADGKSCDCGCGIADPDCKDEGVNRCDVCAQPGSCARGPCPSNVAADDNTRCTTLEGWECGELDYGDGFCDCGCGVIDIDCASKNADACDSCPVRSCAEGNCMVIIADDNTACSTPPRTWTCNTRLFRDGTHCDCGCGAHDPDCGSTKLDACDSCNEEGSCSGLACPGAINPTDNKACIQLPAPPDWVCYPSQYGDGSTCDCGCGVQDADCRTNSITECVLCNECGPDNDCQRNVNHDDPTQCTPPPAGWTCPAEWYGRNYTCDCGCGVLDRDCLASSRDYCSTCEGCAAGHCDRIDPHDTSKCDFELPAGWTCAEGFYGDSVCDCGCGAPDPDCLGSKKSDCDSCDDPGSCSTVVCKDPTSKIKANDNTSCSE